MTGSSRCCWRTGSIRTRIDKTGKAPIVYAAGLGFTPIVRRLLDAGVDVNARYGNDLTVLMWAAGYAENAGALDAESRRQSRCSIAAPTSMRSTIAAARP